MKYQGKKSNNVNIQFRKAQVKP